MSVTHPIALQMVGLHTHALWLVLLLLLAAAAAATAGETPIPPAWAAAVARGDMLIHAEEARGSSSPLDARLRPNIGNGFLATLGGSASVYLAGVYNLSPLGAAEPFRARLPGLAAMTVSLPDPEVPTVQGGLGACINAPPAGRARCPSPPTGPTPASCAAQGCCFIPDVSTYCAAKLNSSSCSDKCQIEGPPSAPLAPKAQWADVEALDMKHATYLQLKQSNLRSLQHQRTSTKKECTVIISQRTYAHRVRLSLLATDYTLTATSGCKAGTKLQLWADLTNATLQDFLWEQRGNTSHAAAFSNVASAKADGGRVRPAAVYTGTTLRAEKQGRKVNVAFATLALQGGPFEMLLIPGGQVNYSFPTAFVSDASENTPRSADALAKLATDILSTAVSLGPEALFAEHTAAVTRDAKHSAIGIVGDLGLAQVVNSTLYSLRASLSPLVEWSTSPGGLSTGGRWTADGHDTKGGTGYPEGSSSYYGHVFWDADVWMLPAMLPIAPNISRAMIHYRFKTMSAAIDNARNEGRNGTKWAWESAFSGVSATGNDNQEIHLQAGIGMAVRSYFRATHDVAFLEKTGWPMLENIVAFFKSRVTPMAHDGQWNCLTFNATERAEIARCAKAGREQGTCQRETCTADPTHVWTGGNNTEHDGCGICWCCVKSAPVLHNGTVAECPAGHSCLGLNGVQSPNEYASGINNDIYTNTAFASVLEFTALVAKLLDKPNPAQYSKLARRIIIPFNRTLGRHEEYTGAAAALRIKQSTLTMVPYPVEYPMPTTVQRRDLEYEAAHIGTEGPAMTHSMLAIDWLSLNNGTGGNLELKRSYSTNLVGPFLQWMECPIPPDYCQGHRPATNFLTAAGGFIQAVIYGFVGLRYNDLNMTLAPMLPGDARQLTLYGLHYRGAVLRVSFAASQLTIVCESGCTPPLCASTGATEPAVYLGRERGTKRELAAEVQVKFPSREKVTVEPGPC